MPDRDPRKTRAVVLLCVLAALGGAVVIAALVAMRVLEYVYHIEP
jgi:hypothetical protein